MLYMFSQAVIIGQLVKSEHQAEDMLLVSIETILIMAD
jgi:hypothetical protein